MKFLTVFCAVLIILSAGTAHASIGWANYQWPCYGASYADNASISIYSQAWKGGCTDQPGPCPDLSAILYYKKTVDTNYVAVPMVFNVDAGNNDEFTAQIPSSATESGYQEQYYIVWHDASDNTDYNPMDHCGGGTVPPMVLNITPATEQDVTVVFRVNMTCLPQNLYSAGVFFAGDFQGWNACTSSMSDANNDGIYEGSFVFPAGSNPYHEFKFNRSGSDGCQWENAIGNRSFIINDTQPTMVLDVAYWDNTPCCVPSGPAEITGAGSYCVSLCLCGNVLSIPLNTQYNPPILQNVTFVQGCHSWTGACDNNCQQGNGTVSWGTHQDPAGQWYLDLCQVNADTEGCFCMTIDQILPVEFGEFDAVAGDNQVTLNWNTRSELDNARFDVVRDGATVAQVPSFGNSSSGHNYTWVDRSVVNGTSYSYTLMAVDINGSRTELATASATPHAETVTDYELTSNYPNPFNPSTSFGYSLKDAGLVTLRVYDLAGRMVKELVNAEQASGRYTVSFDGTGLASGIYYYRLSVNGFTATHKMILMR